MMQTIIYIWPYMYNSLYGRFLLLQLGGTGNVLILNVLICLYSFVGKVASRSSLGLLMKLMYVDYPPIVFLLLCWSSCGIQQVAAN